jgi:hypothetical protein
MRGMFQIKTFCVEAAEYNDVYTLVNEQSLVCAANTLKAQWEQKRSNNTTFWFVESNCVRRSIDFTGTETDVIPNTEAKGHKLGAVLKLATVSAHYLANYFSFQPVF